MAQIPKNKPQWTRDELIAQINKHYPSYMSTLFAKDKFVLVGVRGYYKNTLGKPRVNDRAIYDDAMFILTADDFYSFNANCDPSKYKPGIATLVANVYRGVYKFDQHHGSKGSYDAICQRLGNVVVIRDGKTVNDKPAKIGINIHMGGNNTTSSLGCQTIPPTQWKQFYATAKRIFQKTHGDAWNTASPTYILFEN